MFRLTAVGFAFFAVSSVLANHALFYTDGKRDLLVENCMIVDNNLTYTLRGYDGTADVGEFQC